VGKLRLNRNQLATFLPDDESIRAFEDLFSSVDEITSEADSDDIQGDADVAIAKANKALAETNKLKQSTFESVNKNIKSYNKSFTHTGVRLDSIAYTFGSKTITKTLGYTGINLTTVTLSGSTPSRIKLVKTLTYSGLNLTSVAYT
jgi:hypothetical protein